MTARCCGLGEPSDKSFHTTCKNCEPTDFGLMDLSSLSARNYPALVAGDHRADGAGAEVLGAGGGGGLWSGHSRQGNL